MQRRIVSCMIIVGILALAGVAMADVIDNLNAGEWYQVPNSHIRSVLPSPVPPGDPTGIITAWGGGAFDTNRNLYLITGGGHNDYGGNEVYGFSIATLTWSIVSPPSPSIPAPGARECTPRPIAETESDGKPSSKHVYDGMDYLPNVDRMFITGGSMYCAGGFGSFYTWTLNLATQAWTHMADVQWQDLELVSAYNPNDGLEYVMGNSDSIPITAFNPVTNAWTRTGSQGAASHMSGVIDPVQNKFLAFGEGRAYEFNLTTLAKTIISTTGPQLIVNTFNPGLAYDPIRAKIVGWDGGANIYTYDTVTRVWTLVQPAGTNTVIPTATATDAFGNHVTHGKWQYIPSKHAFIVVNSIDENVYIYKSTATGSNLPPTAPTSPASVADSYQQVSVTWTAATDPDGTVSSYNVYRCDTSNCTPPATGPIGNVVASPFVDTTVAPSTTYRYRVSAVDNSGLEGPQSTITANTTTPAAPAFDFTVAATPSTLSVAQGGAQNQETITVTRTAGTAAPVTITNSSLPTNATATYSPSNAICTPSPTTCTVTMTVTTGTGTTTPTGNTTVTMTGTAGATVRTGNFTLTVTALPSFDFTVTTTPSSISAAQNGGQGQETITVTRTTGTALAVTLTNSALPANANAVFSPNPCTAYTGDVCTSTMTITTGSGTTTPTGNTSVTVTGTAAGPVVRTSAAFTFTVTAAGGVSLPDNTWVVRTVPLFPAAPPNNYSGLGGSKHVNLTYDASRGLIYFWGGDYQVVEGAYDRTNSQERMWSYNVATDTWAAVLTEAQASAAGNPKGVCNAATAYDSSRQVWWMTGGEERAQQGCYPATDCYPPGLVSCYMWAFRPSNNTWYRAGPSPDCSAAPQTTLVPWSSEVKVMQYNPVQDELLVPCQNGGIGGYLCTYSLAGITLGDAGGHDNWTQRVGLDVGLFEQLAFAIDTPRNRAIFYESGLDQTWMYNLSTRAWTQLNSQHLPNRDLFGLVYDSAQDIMVIFGGLDDYEGCTGCTFLNTVWTLSMSACPGAGCQWVQRTIGGPTIPPRHGDNIAYDSGNDAIVVWGGTGGFQQTIDQYGRNGSELWLLRLNVGTADTTPPTVSLTAPSPGTVSGNAVTVTASASDNVGVAGVQFKLDGANLQAEDFSSPYSISWDSYTTTNGSHSLTAVARDTSSNTTPSAAVVVTVSNSAPAAPTGLSVTATSATQTHGIWTASAGGAASGYKVYRCTESSPPTPCTPTSVIQTLGNVLVFDDTLLTPSTTYCYAVSGTNLVGEGTKSTAFCVATPAAGAPATPTNFVLNPPTVNQVSGSWIASAGATGYKIYRCSGASCTPIPPALQTLGASPTTFIDATVVGGTTYGYSVSATNGSGESALFTPTAEVTVPTANPPLTPTGFTVASQGPNRVNGAWNVAGDATGYKVLRCTGAGCTPVDPPLQTLGVVTSFVDLTPVATLTYGYALQATNVNGPSPSTATQYVTMPAQTCAGTLTNVTPATIDNFINTHTWVPGDTLALGAGNYPNGLSLYNINGTVLCPITVTGPTSGSPAIILGSAGANTLRLQNDSYLIVQYLEINPQNLGGDGVNNQGTTHDITLQNLYIHGCKDLCTVALCGYDADNPIDSQGIVGISTNRAMAWNWTIRRNTITDCGTGMYLGDSDGNEQFLNGLIEYNLIYDTLGYNAEIKQMNPLPVPGPSGMPTGTTKTVIRYNTWSKANNSNGGPIANDGLERPCLTLGYAPLTGPAAPQENYYEVYGNFFYQNPFEALFQAAGNVALYDNLFVNTLASGNPAVNFQFHNGGPPRIIRAFQNTIVNNATSGIVVSGGNTSFTQSAIGNAVFSGAPQISVATMATNTTGTYASASTPLTNPFAAPGAGLDLFPKAGQLSGTPIDSSTYNTYLDYNRDFNAVNRPTNTIRGAYGSQGTNPGWLPLIAIQPTRVTSGVVAPAAPTNLRVIMQP